MITKKGTLTNQKRIQSIGIKFTLQDLNLCDFFKCVKKDFD
jgi:hypothetical protein